MKKPVKIISTGKYLPGAIDSSFLEKKYGLPEGWSVKYSGVQKRHYVTHESAGFMGARALQSALDKAHLTLKDIDLLIAASATFDYPIPSQASIIKSEMEQALTHNLGAMDVNSTCLSFVSAFEVAANMLDGKHYKNIAIVSAEIASKGLDKLNWETLTLFGDAAVAVIVSYDQTEQSYLMKSGLRTYSEGVYDTMVKGGGNQFHIRDFPYETDLHTFKMNGIRLLKMAKKHVPEFMDWFFEDLELGFLDVDAIIPHQASKMGLALIESAYSFKKDQFKSNLKDHGNCIGASIPLLLHDEIEKGGIKRGDTCMLTGTSAGFSIGGVLIKY